MLLVGVADWNDQAVSAIGVDEGAVPQGAEVVTDRMNARSGRYSGDISDELQVADSTGIPSALEVSGRGDTLLFSEVVAGEEAVLYAPQSTVNELAGSSGVNSIEFRVEDPEDADAVATAVRERLIDLEPGSPSPTCRGRATGRRVARSGGVQQLRDLMYVGALLTLLSRWSSSPTR